MKSLVSSIIRHLETLDPAPRLLDLLHLGAKWLSGRVLDWRPKNCGFEPHRCHCIVSVSKTH